MQNITHITFIFLGLNQDLALQCMVWRQKAAVSTTASIDTQMSTNDSVQISGLNQEIWPKPSVSSYPWFKLQAQVPICG